MTPLTTVTDDTGVDHGRGLESRYARQQEIPWWDQDRLRRARVLVVGAGALGNEVVKNLALLGVGHMVVVDPDVVEVANLARCVLFRSGDEGAAKAEVVARRARDLNPHIDVNPIVDDVRSLGTGIAIRADVIVGALDNRVARLYCNRLAARTAKHWVDGAIESLTAVARVFHPPQCCYECTLTEADWKDLARRRPCRSAASWIAEGGGVPTTVTSASVAGAVEAQEVVKLLHLGQRAAPLSGALVVNGEANDVYHVTYPIDPDCLAHHQFDSPTRIEVDHRQFLSTTLEQVAAEAWPAVEPSPACPVVIDLLDDHRVGWWCPACERADDRAGAIGPRPSACPWCGSERRARTVSQVTVPGPYAALTLGDLGLRYDEILPARHGEEESFVWLDAPDPRLPPSWAHPEQDGH